MRQEYDAYNLVEEGKRKGRKIETRITEQNEKHVGKNLLLQRNFNSRENEKKNIAKNILRSFFFAGKKEIKSANISTTLFAHFNS